MLDLSLEEMRKNPWLLDQAFDSLRIIPYVADKYGQNNINAAKEWLANNKIDIYMRPREDKDVLPCVTVYPGESQEKIDMKSLGDLSPDKIILLPKDIGKPIPFVVKPFSPLSYDMSTGNIAIDQSTPGLDLVSPGMVLVNPATGYGYIIQAISANGVLIEPNLTINTTQFAIVPQYQYYEARIKHTFNQETYLITCYAHGDVQNLIWLHTIVYYAIMRYRQALLEGNGFAESVVSSGSIDEDSNYAGAEGEKAYARTITISGQVEQSWIDAPKRFIETIVANNVPNTTNPVTGIQIISNLNTPSIINEADESWITINDD